MVQFACDVDIDQLDKDIDRYTELTARMQLAYLKAGRSKATPAYRAAEEARNLVDDRMSEALDELIYQIEHGATQESVQKALDMSSEWRTSINVHKEPRNNPRGWVWGGYIGRVERAAHYGLQDPPQTFPEWLAANDISNVPPYSRNVFDIFFPDIHDWVSMHQMLDFHRERIDEAKAILSAYNHVVETMGKEILQHENQRPTTKPDDYPLPVWEKHLVENGWDDWQGHYIWGADMERRTNRDIIARKIAEYHGMDDTPEREELKQQIKDAIQYSSAIPQQWRSHHHSPETAARWASEAAARAKREIGADGYFSKRKCGHCQEWFDEYPGWFENHKLDCPVLNPELATQSPVDAASDEMVEEEDVDEFVAQVMEWQNDIKYRRYRDHVYRWERVLQALGLQSNHPTLKGNSPRNPMPLKEVDAFILRGWGRWKTVRAEYKKRGIK